MRQIWFLLLVLPLMSCTQPLLELAERDLSPSSVWEERQKQILNFSDWSLSGRLVMKVASRTEHASFFWTGGPDKKEVRLLGPFGNGRLRLYEDSYGAMLQDASGEQLVGSSVDELLTKVINWPIPFVQMNYWVRGLPGPGEHMGIALDYAGRARSFVQDGWKVEYTDYGIFDGVYLPQRINIGLLLDKASVDQMNFSGDDAFGAVSVKLSIGSWSYSQGSE